MKPTNRRRYTYVWLASNLFVAAGAGIIWFISVMKPEDKMLFTAELLQIIAGFLCAHAIFNLMYLVLADRPTSAYTDPKRFAFSQREKEVIMLIHKGYSNKMIGESLYISPFTVKKHIYNIFRKVNVTNRIALLRAIGL
jgi:DNA-binding NarL/FixJ family response regulator